MRVSLFSYFLLTFLFFTTLQAQNTTLVINEISQGAGSKEYVELLVISEGNTSCVRPTLDLRKWIIDDNNGYFKAGSGSGIAAGAMRFADNPFWSAIPAGTLILIYNATDYNSAIIPSTDVSNDDGNCRLIIPSNSNLLEKSSVPNNSQSNYPTSGWTTGGDWTTIAMRNDGDALQIYRPNNTTTPVHSVSFGDNTLHQDIYFSGSSAGLVYSFKNIVSDDYHNQSNWVSQPISGNETPGLPNDSKNNTYILSQSHNCSSTINNGDFSLQTSILQPTTCGEDNGILGSTITGGTAPFTYSWSTGESTNQINQVGSGDYTLIVADANGCKDTSEIHLPSSPAGPTVNLSAHAATCGATNGSITTTVNGGVSPYQYQWSNGATSQNISNLSEGNYSLTVTDAQGCSDSQSSIVNGTANLEITSIDIHEANCGANNGSITLDAKGGVLPYSYEWSTGGITNSITNLATGTYSVTITDAAGCSVTETFMVPASNDLSVNIDASSTSLTDGQNSTLTANVSGGTAPYEYIWQPSEGLNCENCQTVIATPSANTTYTVQVTSSEGCVGNASINLLFEKICGEVFIPNIFSPNYDGVNDVFLVQGKCITNGSYIILNRWGEIVFQTNDIDEQWDGTFRGSEVATGVYFYSVEVDLENQGTKNYSGSITLTR